MLKRSLAMIFLTLGFASSLGFGQAKAVSKPAPKFESFRVPTPMRSRTADAGFSSWAAAQNRDQTLRDVAKDGPNFAGRFVVEETTCGSQCVLFYIVDVKTGAIFEGGVVATGCKNLGGPDFRLNSKLLVVSGQRESYHPYQRSPCGEYYYEWDGKRLKQIRFIAGDDYDN